VLAEFDAAVALLPALVALLAAFVACVVAVAADPAAFVSLVDD